MPTWWPSDLIPWASFGAGAGAGFVFLKWLLEWVAGRVDKNRDALDAGTQKHIDRLEKHIDDLLRWRAEDAEKIRLLEDKTDECERERAELRARVLQLEALMNARGEIRQRAQLIVAAEKAEAKK